MYFSLVGNTENRIFVYTNDKVMTGYRYNSEKREDRKYNNCGMEKNPNAIKFYASNLKYAENYRLVHNDDGEVVQECDLEVTEISGVNLFDMANDFKTLSTYKNYISHSIGEQMKDYSYYLNNAKTAKERKMWEGFIDELKNREVELISNLISFEFQPLSDFDRQNELVAELRELGYDGYFTKNEIAIF